jgi:small subunit ribosomal protein S7
MTETQNVLLFRKWDLSKVEIRDPGLKNVISLKKETIPMSFGRSALKRFNKAEVNIVERLINKLSHFGKKYAKNTGRMGGKKIHAINTVRAAFDIINLKTGKNPIEVLIKAIENSAPNEDTTRIVYGGTVYHVSVDVAPLRRVDLALRFIAEGVRDASFTNPKAIEENLVEHLILAAANDMNAPSIKKKNELERIAMASR